MRACTQCGEARIPEFVDRDVCRRCAAPAAPVRFTRAVTVDRRFASDAWVRPVDPEPMSYVEARELTDQIKELLAELRPAWRS